jgi:ATP-dependent exoDNAse (exonuclease V) alpha subunit
MVPTKRLCAGDVDQLPPVGAGKVLTDAIQSGVIPGVDLREIFRQAQQSGIVRTAHAVNGGNFQAVQQGLPSIDPTHVKASVCVSSCVVAVSAALQCVQKHVWHSSQVSTMHVALHGTSACSSHNCM